MTYADKLGVPFVVLLGEDEIAQGKCSVKNMTTGEQVTVTADEAARLIKTTLDTREPLILEK